MKRNSLPVLTSLVTLIRPAHQLGQSLADGQAQACPAVAACGRGIDLAERLEQAPDAILGDADAGVPDREGQLVERRRAPGGAGAHREDDLTALGELDRVREQVQEDLAQARHVADDRRGSPVAEHVCQVEALLGGPRRHEVERPLDAFPEVEGLRLQIEPPRLDLREVQDVVDDGQERVAALADDLGIFALLVAQRGVQEEPAHPDDGIHRRPDLVAHRRQEGGLGLVGGLGLPAGPEKLGDVVVDRDDAHLGAVDDHGHCRGLDVHRGAVLPEAPRDRTDPLTHKRLTQVGQDFFAGLRRRHEIHHISPNGLRLGVSEEPHGAGVPPYDRPAEIHGGDRHRARLHERVRVLLLALDLPEESGIVNGQHRLGREGLQHSNHLGRESAPLGSQDHEATEHPVLPDQRDCEEGAQAFSGEEPPHLGGDELPLVINVGDLDGFPDHSGSTNGPLAEPDRHRP